MAVLVGDIGRSVTPLGPSGWIMVGGDRLDARSDGPFIGANRPVIVMGGDSTGYIVRELQDGQPPPRLPNRGQPVRTKGEAHRTPAEAAAAERAERQKAGVRTARSKRRGAVAAGGLGAVVGLASGCVGWQQAWAGALDGAGIAGLLAVFAAVGAGWGIVLFFVTGFAGKWVGSIHAIGEPDFAPDYLAVLAGLVGAAAGFWWQFGVADVTATAVVTVGCSAAAAAIAWVLVHVLGVLLGVC